jgi:fatty acid desaturase
LLQTSVALSDALEKRAFVQAATIDTSKAAFRELALQVRAAGLLNRRPGYYGAKIGLTLAAFAAGWAAFVAVGNSWATLGLAAFLGVMCAQLGFIGHDLGHQQVFGSRRANRLLGLAVGNALIGLCYGWWVPKHSAHHAHPNEVGRDPDIGDGLFVLTSIEGRGTVRRNLARLLERWQAPLFFPLMILRSVGLHVSGAQYLLRRRDPSAAVEGLLVALHVALFSTVVLLVLSPLRALAFVAVEQAVFSLYLGCSFAPNHKAMPIVATDAEMGFARRQVLTARNIAGGGLITLMLGGLNFQIEHHLFPSMPRPNLKRAQSLVREFCLASELSYCEASLSGSFRRIIRHLERRGQTGLQADPMPLEVARTPSGVCFTGSVALPGSAGTRRGDAWRPVPSRASR